MKFTLFYRLFNFENSYENFKLFINIEKFFKSSNFYKKVLIVDPLNDYIKDYERGFFDEIFITNFKNDLAGLSEFILTKKFHLDSSNILSFLTSGSVGPFIKKKNDIHWTSQIISKMEDNLGIIFPIVEIPRYTDYYGSVFLKENKKVPKDSFSVPFGHSYCFHLTKKGFDCLYEKDFFQLGELDKEKAILKYERILTSYILNEGLKVKGLNEPFNELDLGDSKIWDSRHFCLSYFETTDPENLGDGSKENIFKLNPYQVRFIKNIKLPHIYRPLHLSGISEELQKEIDYLISNFNH
ncbi:MAG: hypothetical protein CMG00_01635 [Candidatus Marinimicrobia bacterium]|nr:hypothetical protein [Candidatus Neomarinimicrobiota bacterium]|tara:strand:+ start:103 stop:993 length:891 start_codon:yes stop_codon:yes gene_type:complete